MCLFYISFMHICVCLYEFICTTCLQRPMEAKWEPKIPWNYGYSLLWATRWVLGTKSSLSAWAEKALNYWAFCTSLTCFMHNLDLHIARVLYFCLSCWTVEKYNRMFQETSSLKFWEDSYYWVSQFDDLVTIEWISEKSLFTLEISWRRSQSHKHSSQSIS